MGAIAGTIHGASAFPEEWLEQIERENNMELSAQAEKVEKLWHNIL